MGNSASISVIKVETERRRKVNRKRRRVVGGFCCFGKKGEVRKIYDEIKGSDDKNII
tara:strand:- start:378 stop:548 length:171 start_codon:yes stop_codon:yes gene_type:complete